MNAHKKGTALRLRAREGERERLEEPNEREKASQTKTKRIRKKTIKSFNLILGQENVLIKMKRRHIKPIISKWKWKRCDIFAYN